MTSKLDRTGKDCRTNALVHSMQVSQAKHSVRNFYREDPWFVYSYEEIQPSRCPSPSALQHIETLPTYQPGPTASPTVYLCLCCQANGLVCQAGMRDHVWRAPRASMGASPRFMTSWQGQRTDT